MLTDLGVTVRTLNILFVLSFEFLVLRVLGSLYLSFELSLGHWQITKSASTLLLIHSSIVNVFPLFWVICILLLLNFLFNYLGYESFQGFFLSQSNIFFGLTFVHEIFLFEPIHNRLILLIFSDSAHGCVRLTTSRHSCFSRASVLRTWRTCQPNSVLLVEHFIWRSNHLNRRFLSQTGFGKLCKFIDFTLVFLTRFLRNLTLCLKKAFIFDFFVLYKSICHRNLASRAHLWSFFSRCHADKVSLCVTWSSSTSSKTTGNAFLVSCPHFESIESN